jgi:hypothetical protein
VEIPDIDPFPEDDLRRADAAEARLQGGDLRRADEAEAYAEQSDRSAAFDRAVDAEMPGFAGDETR